MAKPKNKSITLGKSGNRRFDFKQFTVYDDECAMKIGTDAVLLASWCDVLGVDSAVDFGSGSGIIALMIAQRAPLAEVFGIELEPGAAQQAAYNFQSSPFHTRLHLLQDSVQEFAKNLEKRGGFDLVITNPPYFHNKPKSPIKARNLARHDESLPLEELLQSAHNSLKIEGRLCMVWPMERKHELIQSAKAHGFELIRICDIAGSPAHSPIRFLSEWIKADVLSESNSSTMIEPERLNIELGIRHDGKPEHSQYYKQLLEEFVRDWD